MIEWILPIIGIIGIAVLVGWVMSLPMGKLRLGEYYNNRQIVKLWLNGWRPGYEPK